MYRQGFCYPLQGQGRFHELVFRYRIYYYDSIKKVIERMNVTGSGQEEIVSHGVPSVQGIAVDWVGNKLYWTDGCV